MTAKIPSQSKSNNYPKDRSLTLTRQARKRLLKNKKGKEKKGLLTKDAYQLLKTPRQSILTLEPVIKNYMIRLYDKEKKSEAFKDLTEIAWRAKLAKEINEHINGGLERHTQRAKVRKRARIRFFAKAILGGRLKSIEQCIYVAKEADHLFQIDIIKGLMDLVIDTLTIFDMTLLYCYETYAQFSASFLSTLLTVFGESLIVLSAVLQVISILKENNPPKLIHYVQVIFTLTMTVLGLIASIVGAMALPFIGIALSLSRSLVIFNNELINYYQAPKDSDKQMAHGQACVECIGNMILSTLGLTVMLLVVSNPVAALTLTSIIMTLLLLKMSWNFLATSHKMALKEALGMGKKDYQEVLITEEKEKQKPQPLSKSAFFEESAKKRPKEEADQANLDSLEGKEGKLPTFKE